MKNLGLLTWLTQLGLSVAVPPVGFILLALWLQRTLAWGAWVLWVGVALGVICGIYGFVNSLQTMFRMAGSDREKSPPVAFNDHE
jgi:hypothetical protein